MATADRGFEKHAAELPHTFVIENRESANISGVTDVLSFDENLIILETGAGGLTLTGSDMHIEMLSLDTGDLSVAGHIDSAVYSNEREPSGGFFQRLFR